MLLDSVISPSLGRADPPRTRPTELTPTCTGSGCHDSIVQRPFIHGPVAQRTCQACHVPLEPRQHTFRSAMTREKMCISCHELPSRDVTHQPVAAGDCTACHDPHGSKFRAMLRADPATQLCLTCHADLGYADKKNVHGPVAAGACILCHDAHSSWYPRLLTRAPRDICVSCHSSVQDSVKSKRHTHPPVSQGLCTICHDPHASDHRGQLKGDGITLCVDCHEPIGHAIKTSAVVHGAVKQGDGCIECHAGHATDLPSLQRDAEPASCLKCHDRPLIDASGRRLIDMAALLKENPDHHGPIRQGQCTACHDPHASPRARLLSAEYPVEFYAPFDLNRYKLCFTCHQPEMVTAAKGRGVTGFRDGENNLHYIHVNQPKGRTCRTCHEVHASKNPFHMRDAVLFGTGDWELKINFTKRDNGGFCAPGCHADRTYDRDRPAPAASSSVGGSP